MEIVIQPSSAAATTIAAHLIGDLVRKKPAAVLGLPTGGTPLLLYRKLVEMKLDWRRITTFNLDEYAEIPRDHPQSYRSFMRENFFRHINIKEKNTHIPDSLAKDIPAACERYERQIREAGGIDLQVLGIGANGHIGFNEPGSSLASRTRIKTLAPQTRRDNAHFFGGEKNMPLHAVTMGIGTIMDARHCLLLAFGKKKAQAVAAAVEGPVSARHPASVLQMHPKVTFFLDAAAATALKLKAYYRWTYENKPAWQKF